LSTKLGEYVVVLVLRGGGLPGAALIVREFRQSRRRDIGAEGGEMIVKVRGEHKVMASLDDVRTVTCHWDKEAHVWFVAETDVPGLATEAATVEEMEDKLLRMVPELRSAKNPTPRAARSATR
jgi:hypothetical protein